MTLLPPNIFFYYYIMYVAKSNLYFLVTKWRIMIKIHCVFSSNGLWKYSGGVNINLFFNLFEIEICLLSRMTLNQVFQKRRGREDREPVSVAPSTQHSWKQSEKGIKVITKDFPHYSVEIKSVSLWFLCHRNERFLIKPIIIAFRRHHQQSSKIKSITLYKVINFHFVNLSLTMCRRANKTFDKYTRDILYAF